MRTQSTWGGIFHAATFAAAVCGVVAVVAEYRGVAIAAGVLTAVLAALSAYASYFDTSAGLSELRQHFTWRSLSLRQREAITEQLRGRGVTVEVDWSQTRESEAYAREIRAALEAAGCTVTSSGGVTPEGAHWGLLGPGPDFTSTEARCLHNAFHAASLSLRPVLDVTARPRILVGTKPPAMRPAPPEQPISGVRPNPPFDP